MVRLWDDQLINVPIDERIAKLLYDSDLRIFSDSSVSFIPKLNWLIDMLNREQIVRLIAWGASFDSLQPTEQTSGWHRWRFPICQETLCLPLSSFSINIGDPTSFDRIYVSSLQILLNHRLHSVKFYSVNGFN